MADIDQAQLIRGDQRRDRRGWRVSRHRRERRAHRRNEASTVSAHTRWAERSRESRRPRSPSSTGSRPLASSSSAAGRALRTQPGTPPAHASSSRAPSRCARPRSTSTPRCRGRSTCARRFRGEFRPAGPGEAVLRPRQLLPAQPEHRCCTRNAGYAKVN
jgi:hypothetical protein